MDRSRSGLQRQLIAGKTIARKTTFTEESPCSVDLQPFWLRMWLATAA